MNKNNNKTLLLLLFCFAIFSQIDSEKNKYFIIFWEHVQLRQTAQSLLQEIL
jgi:hypothetical protein